jgi:hypothetical protein
MAGIEALQLPKGWFYELVWIENGGDVEAVRLRGLDIENCFKPTSLPACPLAKIQILADPSNSMSRARQLGVRAAQGELILFVDLDVKVVSVLALRDLLEQAHSQEAVTGWTGVAKFPFASTWWQQSLASASTSWLGHINSVQIASAKKERSVDHLPGGFALFRRKAIASRDFDPRFVRWGEDLDMGLQITSRGGQLRQVPALAYEHSASWFTPLSWARRVFGLGRGRVQVTRKWPSQIATLPVGGCILLWTFIAVVFVGSSQLTHLIVGFLSLVVLVELARTLYRTRGSLAMAPGVVFAWSLTISSYALGQIFQLGVELCSLPSNWLKTRFHTDKWSRSEGCVS